MATPSLSRTSDHVAGALFGVLGIAATIAAILLGMSLLVMRPHGNDGLARALGAAVRSLYVWGSVILAASGVLGFALGADRITPLLGHLWFTERPRKLWLSAFLWIVLVGVAYSAYAAATFAQAL
jgi:hypothetical protein